MRGRFLVASLAALALAAVPAAAAPLGIPFLPAVADCAAAGSHRAAIVVEHGDGAVVRRCVAFSGDAVTGEQLLKLSGIEYQTQSFGSFGDATCQIDGEPARYTECLGRDFYWGYFVSRSGGGWQFSATGMSEVTLHDGDAEGFRYISTSGSPAAPPSPAGVCLPLPTPKPTPVATPRPTTIRMAAPSSAPIPAAAASSAPAASATATSSPAATDTATPDRALATPSPEPTVEPVSTPSGGSGPDGGLMTAAAAGAALAVLAAIRAIGRRRTRS